MPNGEKGNKRGSFYLKYYLAIFFIEPSSIFSDKGVVDKFLIFFRNLVFGFA